jgi:hypothetical protein
MVLSVRWGGLRAGTLGRALNRDDDVDVNLLRGPLRLLRLLRLHLLALRLNQDGNWNALQLAGQGSSVKVPDTIVVDGADPEIFASSESEKIGRADVEALVS